MVINSSILFQGIRSAVTGGDAGLPCTGAPGDCR